jgi:2-C-methyl-D-erythritol 4-phosphate cytidylyltransferase
VWTVVVAAGSGRRFGGPKQFASVAGRLVVEWSVAAARAATDGVVVVVPPGNQAVGPSTFGADAVVEGGPTRSASVRLGLAAVPAIADVVIVHDAARPLAVPALFQAVIAAVSGTGISGSADGADGAVCAVPVVDTIKRVVDSGGVITVGTTLERSDLVAVQTPQAFRADVLRRAHSDRTAVAEPTDDATLVEALGGSVRVVPGDPANIKVTTRADLFFVEHMLAGESTRGPGGCGSGVPGGRGPGGSGSAGR